MISTLEIFPIINVWFTGDKEQELKISEDAYPENFIFDLNTKLEIKTPKHHKYKTVVNSKKLDFDSLTNLVENELNKV